MAEKDPIVQEGAIYPTFEPEMLRRHVEKKIPDQSEEFALKRAKVKELLTQKIKALKERLSEVDVDGYVEAAHGDWVDSTGDDFIKCADRLMGSAVFEELPEREPYSVELERRRQERMEWMIKYNAFYHEVLKRDSIEPREFAFFHDEERTKPSGWVNYETPFKEWLDAGLKPIELTEEDMARLKETTVILSTGGFEVDTSASAGRYVIAVTPKKKAIMFRLFGDGELVESLSAYSVSIGNLHYEAKLKRALGEADQKEEPLGFVRGLLKKLIG